MTRCGGVSRFVEWIGDTSLEIVPALSARDLRRETDERRPRGLPYSVSSRIYAKCVRRVTRVTVTLYPWDTTADYTFSSTAKGGRRRRAVCRITHIRTHTYTHTPVVLLGARYGGFIPKGYVAIVLTPIAATMAGYSSALNTDFAPESARRMQRSAIDAIGNARESSVYAITRYIPYVLRNSSDIKELLNYRILRSSCDVYY